MKGSGLVAVVKALRHQLFCGSSRVTENSNLTSSFAQPKPTPHQTRDTVDNDGTRAARHLTCP